MGIAIYVCITFVRHNIIKSALQTIYDQQSARSTSSILNCSEASLGYRPLFTGCLRNFFLGPIQFLQTDHFVLSILQSQVSIGVHGHANVRMTHQVLQCLWVHAGACHVAAVGMAADVGRDVGNLDSVNLIVAFDHMVEAVFPVHCNLRQTLLVQKQEATVAVNDFLHRWCFPVLQNSLEASVDILCHRNLPRTGVCLGAFNVNCHASALKLMVDVDDPVLHIQISDGQSTELGNSHSGVEQDENHLVVFAVNVIVVDKFQKCFSPAAVPMWFRCLFYAHFIRSSPSTT